MLEQTTQLIWLWLATHGLRIALVVVLAWLAQRVLNATASHFNRLVDSRTTGIASESLERARTLTGVFRSASVVIIFVIAALTILSELGVDITPFIAGAGIIGLAIGFGAQTLVKDLIGGLFILIEDQFHVGDSIRVGGVSGVVAQISLRTTSLRDGDGTLHMVPNGDIRIVSNATVGWSRAIVDVRVGYDQDADRVIQALKSVVADASNDPALKPHLLEPLALTGVEALDTDTMRLRLLGKTRTGEQEIVNRALRQRIKEKFDAEGIAFPSVSRGARG